MAQDGGEAAADGTVEAEESRLASISDGLAKLALGEEPGGKKPAQSTGCDLLPFNAVEALRWLAWHESWVAALKRQAAAEKPGKKASKKAKKKAVAKPASEALCSMEQKVLESREAWLTVAATVPVLGAGIAQDLAKAAAAIAQHCAAHRMPPGLDEAREGWKLFWSTIQGLKEKKELFSSSLMDSVMWLLWNAAWHAANSVKANSGEEEEGTDEDEEHQREKQLFGEDYPGSQHDRLTDLAGVLRHTVECHWNVLPKSLIEGASIRKHSPKWRGVCLGADVTEAEVSAAASAGFNAVRFPVSKPSASSPAQPCADTGDAGLAELPPATSAAAAAGLSVVLDLSDWQCDGPVEDLHGALTCLAATASRLTSFGGVHVSGVVLPQTSSCSALAGFAAALRAGGLSAGCCAAIWQVDGPPVDDDGEYTGRLLEALQESSDGALVQDGHVVLEVTRPVPSACSAVDINVLDEASKAGEDVDDNLPLGCVKFALPAAGTISGLEEPELLSRWHEELAGRHEASASDATHGWFASLPAGALETCLSQGWSWPQEEGQRTLWPHGSTHTATLVYLHGFCCSGNDYLPCPEYFYEELKPQLAGGTSKLASTVGKQEDESPGKEGGSGSKYSDPNAPDRGNEDDGGDEDEDEDEDDAPDEEPNDDEDEEDDEDESPTFKPIPGLKVVLLTAPLRNITCFDGEVEFAWYDYLTDHDGEAEDDLDMDTLEAVTKQVHAALDKEVASVGADRVFLGGASQGCCTALHAGLTYPGQIAGIVAAQGHLLTCTAVTADWLARRIPVRVFHGEDDTTMPWSKWVSPTYERLQEAGVDIRIATDPGVDHCDEEAEGRWLRAFLKEMLLERADLASTATE